MDSIRLPTFEYPFPHAINPHAEAVTQDTTSWAVREGLLARDAAEEHSQERYGWLAARAHPRATYEALVLVADFMSWLFFQDDRNDKTPTGRRLAQMAEDQRRFGFILDGGSPTPHDIPLCHALRDLTVRMEALASRTWFYEFRRNLIAYFEACQWECRNRMQRTPPRLDTYLSMRPFTSAVFPCFDLFVIADHLELPIAVYDHPSVQDLRFRANNVVSYCNDIYSFEKELRQHDMHNLVILLGIEQRCSLQEAVDRAVELHNHELLAFLSLRERLQSFGLTANGEIERYASCLGSWIWANLDWTLTSTRYQPRPPDPHPPIVIV